MNSKGKSYGGAIRVNVCEQGSPGSARLRPRLHERFFACDGDAIFF